MAKKRKDPSNQAPKFFQDSLNIARAGIISILTKMPVHETKWVLDYEVENRHYHIICYTPEGRPHGIDADVTRALYTLFYNQNCPSHNYIHTTFYELRRLAGMPNNGVAYERIKDSLTRLWATGFMVQEGWMDSGVEFKTTDTLRFFDRVIYHEQISEDLPGIQDDSGITLSVKLSDQIAQSVRKDRALVLDEVTLSKLEMPPSRNLYRILESHRMQGDGTKLMQLKVTLKDWQQACGIVGDRIDNVRRALNAAHEELLSAGYLEGVEYEGRGSKQTLTYRFRAEDDPDPSLVNVLMEHGFTRRSAKENATHYGPYVEEAVQFLEKKLEQGAVVRNRPGLLVDYFKRRDRYVAGQGSQDLADALTGALAVQSVMDAEREAATLLESENQRLFALTPQQQFKEAEKTFKMLLYRRLSLKEQDALARACLSGALLASDLKEQLVRANFHQQMPEFVEGLKEQLSGFVE